MEYVKLGRTGLEVSRICLGCMSYGVPDRGNHAWSLGEQDSRPFIKRALEGRINFFDTANRYSLGSSEEILGRALKDFACRDEVVIATKVYGRMRPGPNGAGLSRRAITGEIDASLHRRMARSKRVPQNRGYFASRRAAAILSEIRPITSTCWSSTTRVCLGHDLWQRGYLDPKRESDCVTCA
jgi:hypothetical protein